MDEPRAVGQVFNIGNDTEVSILELAEIITAITGSNSAIDFVPHHEVFGPTFEDMSRRVPDITKIHELVGFRPRVQLDEILERVVEYWLPELLAAEQLRPVPVPLPVQDDLPFLVSAA